MCDSNLVPVQTHDLVMERSLILLALAWTVSSKRIALLDLSSVRCMLNGAEPVRATTLRSFATHFAACGLRLEALAPGYGMAETCILVSVNAVRPPTIIRVETSTLFVEGNVVVLDGIVEGGDSNTSELVGCGHALC